MATTAYVPSGGHRAKTMRQHVLGDADDNATAVVTIPATSGGSHIIIDEIVAGYNGTAASKVITIAQSGIITGDTYPVVSGAGTVENPKLLLSPTDSYLVGTTAVTITLDSSGSGGTDGFLVVKFRYENQD